MSANDGGAAFPSPLEWREINQATQEVTSGVYDNAHEGMTLRDFFAAKAMAALLAPIPPGEHCDFEALSEDAYGVADAMIAERSKP